MHELEKIYDDFYEIDIRNHSEIVQFYEKNQLILDNKSKFNDVDDFKEHLLVLAQYIISLETLGKYQKAMLYADKALAMILSNIESYNISLKEYHPYWSILTTKGRAHYNMKDYKNAIGCFDNLVSWDSENDNLKIWLDASKSRKRNSINVYLYVTAALLFIIEFSVGRNMLSSETKLLMIKIAFLIFMAAIVNEYLYDKIMKWIKK